MKDIFGSCQCVRQSWIIAGSSVRYSSVNRDREVIMNLKSLPEEISGAMAPLDIEQGFLAESEDGDTVVIAKRSQGTDGNFIYTLTAKNYPSYSAAETTIDASVYDGLAELLNKIERKKRYQWNGWDIDVISEGDRAGRIVAEYILPPNEIHVVIPDLLKSVADLGDQGST